jgi:hypothetical protein
MAVAINHKHIRCIVWELISALVKYLLNRRRQQLKIDSEFCF